MQAEEVRDNKDYMESAVMQYAAFFNSVLDLGCGSGKFLMWVEDLPFTKFIGIDKGEYSRFETYHRLHNQLNINGINQTPSMQYLAKYRALQEQFIRRFTFLDEDVLTYPFEQELYSCIFCNHLIHLLPDEQQPIMLKRIYEALEPNGVAFIKLNTTSIIEEIRDKVTFITPRIIHGYYKGIEKTMYLYNDQEIDSMITALPWTIKNKSFDKHTVKYILKKDN